jgi:hypothetical protein
MEVEIVILPGKNGMIWNVTQHKRAFHRQTWDLTNKRLKLNPKTHNRDFSNEKSGFDLQEFVSPTTKQLEMGFSLQ